MKLLIGNLDGGLCPLFFDAKNRVRLLFGNNWVIGDGGLTYVILHAIVGVWRIRLLYANVKDVGMNGCLVPLRHQRGAPSARTETGIR